MAIQAMKLSEELTSRGLIYQCTAESPEEVLDGKKRTVYLGIDPTAEAIHVGNLVPYILLNHLLRAGHKVVLLMGGGTALIGDPSGRDTEREFVDPSVVQDRAQRMEANIRTIAHGDVTFVNNLDWLGELPLIAFLRDVGKHFTVNAMMKKESVAKRLESEQGISYTEFSYALLQSYDYYHLNREFGCDLQIGGSDQWGNIVSGVDYIRRVSGEEVYGVTVPLVVDKTTGKKFGKSMGNAIWLDPNMTSPYTFYQFWLNTSDEDVIEHLKRFTFIPLDEIDEIESEQHKDPAARIAQRRLAHEMTQFVHGETTADSAARVSTTLFSGGSLESLTEEERHILLTEAPTYELNTDTELTTLLVDTKLATSKREARMFIESNAVELAGEKITDTTFIVTKSPTPRILRRGKKQMIVLV